jgi:polyphosphate kinase 2 (PPK2 family)
VNGKDWSRAAVQQLGEHLGTRQERLFARAKAGADRRRVLLVLQAMDCGGKDGTVRSVVGAMNPLGMLLKAFGPPTEEERAQHFLWRINRALPPAGYIGVFNRSHYEDVLVARVHQLVPEAVWRRRYDEINRFEGDLAEDGLTIVKVMLHISYEEQRERLLARLDEDEFAEHSVRFGYPDEVVAEATAASHWLVSALGDGSEPFASGFRPWLAKVTG